ncbi:conserved hypothetical protein [Methanocella arvoryzae MRE50]|uniref:PD-(D/E)XK motif protein n=1 Tax=Methanocella arvoryzae (strain DSM 22066 / NBRC 105507 / MRE50) TaxID=351160 RepID=Q0W1Z6_METAR|nr:conserved hypothetical protein [Methanocella arvoryzae MRE50]
MLLLVTSQQNIPIAIEYPKSKGFEVQSIILPDDNKSVYLELILTNNRFSDVFTSLVQDIIDHIKNLETEKQAVSVFFGRLLKWQQFLDQYDPEGLSSEAQRGLYGELWVLRKFLLPLLGAKKSIDSWKGPEKYPQDFKFVKTAIEVKTTISKQHEKLTISSEQQLDDTGIDYLYLYHISLINGVTDGETLPEVVESIRTIIKDDFEASKKFEESLITAGYINAHIDRYMGVFYIIRNRNIYKVAEGFPRIIGKNLVNGVGDVHYTINVSECNHFTVPEELLIKCLRGD